MSISDSGNYELLDRLADEFAARYRNGERPPLKDYIDRYPDLADDIRDLFPAMVQIEQAEEDRREADAPAGEDVTLPRLQQLGDFRILREVGKGGMGVVFEAEQVSLGRHVALKVLPKKMLLDAKAKRRFEREAKAAAKLHHTNIVPVFGVGEQDGLPYYVMQFIQGLGLDDVLEELKRIQSTPAGSNASTPGGAVRVARKDMSAANMARSLMTGEFHGTLGLDPAPKLPSAVPNAGKSDPAGTASVTPPDKAVTSAHDDASPATPSGSGGRLSDSFTVSSSSVSLPGQSQHPHRPKAKKLTYFQSVAQIGVQVADALDYAHKQGILHRDIKPSNLLLDMHGTVWVADFGLAKTDDQQDITHTGDILGTLRYMAPEAFEGKSDLRSDVYALGLTLFEMLAMRPAFLEKDRNKLIKQVTASEPPRLERLNPAVPRDLVTIVHKAMEREPAQRYQSAAELEADLHRFIEDEPIKARPLSVRERAWRWCRHNPGIAGLSAALILILVGFSVASALAAAHFDDLARQEAAARGEEKLAKEQEALLRVQAENAQKLAVANLKEADTERRRAEANFAKARAAVDAYFTKVTEDQLLQAPGLQKLRRELLQSALTFYQDFLKERGGDRSLRTDLAATHLRVGRISTDLELEEEALKTLQTAIAAYDELSRENPKEAAYREALADAWESVGDVHYLHGAARAVQMLKAFQMATTYREGLRRQDNPLHQKKLAVTYNRLAISQSMSKLKPEAFESCRKSVEIRHTLLAANPEDPTLHYGMGESFLNLASFLKDEPDRREEALTMYLRSHEFYQFAYAKLPHMVEYGLDLGSAYRHAGDMFNKLERVEEARTQYAKAIEHFRTMGREHPAVPAVQRLLSYSYVSLAYFEEGQGRTGAARQALLDAAAVIERDPTRGADDYCRLACLLGRAISLGSVDEAGRRREADRAMEALTHAVAAGYRDMDQLKIAAGNDLSVLAKRADFKKLLADPEAAGRAQLIKDKQQAAARVNLPAIDAANKARLQSDLAASRHAIGLIQLQMGKFEQAGEALAEEAAIRADLLKAEPANFQRRADWAAAQISLGELHWQAGRLAEAAASWQKTLDLLRPAGAGAEKETALHEFAAALRTIGNSYARAGLWEEASRCYGEWLASGDRSGHQADGEANSLAKTARLAIAAGDNALYAQTCAEALKRVTDWKYAFAPAHAARPWTMAECSADDAASVLGLAEKAFASVPNVWSRNVLALANYRAGKWNAALEAATPSAKFQNLALDPNYPLLAMIHHRLGHAELAREWLDKANGEWRRTSPLARNITSLSVASVSQPSDVNWQNWLDFDLPLHEASQLITGATPLADALGTIHRGYLHMKLNETTKAEAEFQAGVSMRPDDPLVWLARGRAFAALGKADRADADFAKALQVKATDAAAWIDCGRLLAEQGKHKEADAFFAKAAALTSDDLNTFVQAGWWVIGPYPEDLKVPCSPEIDPDPSRPFASVAGDKQLTWLPGQTKPQGHSWLRGPPNGDPISVYALTYVYSPDERTTTFLVGGNDRVRVWLNGSLVHETDRPVTDSAALDHVPVTLKAGRNTVLIKVRQGNPDYYLCLRIADNPLDRATLHAELGLWQEAAGLFARGIDRQSSPSPSQYVRCIHAHLAAGDTAGARRYLQRFAERYDRDEQGASARANAVTAAWLAYGGALVDGALKPARLAELAERALESDAYAWKYYLAGIAHYRAGQFEKALERFSSTSKDARWNPGKTHHGHAVELGMALVKHAQGHAKEARDLLDKAEQWYEKSVQEALATKESPTKHFGWTDWPGFLVLRREAHQRILGTELKADPRIRTLADRMRNWLDQRDKATIDYDVAILRSPAEPRLYLARGRRLAELKRNNNAEADFAKAMQLAPDDPQLLRERGRIYAELGQRDKAATDFANARELNPLRDSKAISPEEAAGMIDERCVVEFEVKSAGKSKGVFFLNSHKDYKDAENFVVFISANAAIAFKNAKIDDPSRYYEGKTIRVAGRVILYQERPEIVIAAPEQIQIVEQKKSNQETSSK